MTEKTLTIPPSIELAVKLGRQTRMQRFVKLWLRAAEDEEFVKADDLTKLCRILQELCGELEIVRYNRNVKKSGIPGSILLLNEKPIAAEKNNISKKDLRFIEDNVLQQRCRPILISGPAGSGKSSLGAQILDNLMHRQLKCAVFDYTRLMQELNELFNQHLEYDSRLNELSSLNALMLDDCFMAACFSFESNVLRDLINLCTDRHCCLMISSQLPEEKWYEHFGDPYAADSIIDRLNAGPIRILLTSESLRKENAVVFGGRRTEKPEVQHD